ncbi:hypothetical protein ACOZCI_26675 [Streptomyces griseoincarnatus]
MTSKSGSPVEWLRPSGCRHAVILHRLMIVGVCCIIGVLAVLPQSAVQIFELRSGLFGRLIPFNV